MSTQSTHAVTLLAGDGIGPEVTEAAVRVLEAADSVCPAASSSSPLT